MRKTWLSWILIALIFGFASSAAAAPGTFSGTLTIRLSGPLDLVMNGSGTGSSDGLGLPATIGGGEFAVLTSASISPPLLGLISQFEIAAPFAPGVPGSNGPLNWTGFVGTMPANASLFLKAFGGITLGQIPLSRVGVGGTQFFTIGGLPGTLFASPYQTGFFLVTGSTSAGSPVAVTASGFDSRTPGGNGLLQIVSPVRVRLGPETIPAAAILALDFTVTTITPTTTTSTTTTVPPRVERVTICHRGGRSGLVRPMTLHPNAVPGHLAHGDFLAPPDPLGPYGCSYYGASIYPPQERGISLAASGLATVLMLAGVLGIRRRA